MCIGTTVTVHVGRNLDIFRNMDYHWGELRTWWVTEHNGDCSFVPFAARRLLSGTDDDDDDDDDNDDDDDDTYIYVH